MMPMRNIALVRQFESLPYRIFIAATKQLRKTNYNEHGVHQVIREQTTIHFVNGEPARSLSIGDHYQPPSNRPPFDAWTL